MPKRKNADRQDLNLSKRETRQDVNGRSQANYDMKLHPIDEYARPGHWARRHGLASPRKAREEDVGEEDDSDLESVLLSSGSEADASTGMTDNFGLPESTQPDPKATRKSARPAASQWHEYRANVHPNDDSIPGYRRKQYRTTHDSTTGSAPSSSEIASPRRKTKPRKSASKRKPASNEQQLPIHISASIGPSPEPCMPAPSSPGLEAYTEQSLRHLLGLSDVEDDLPARSPTPVLGSLDPHANHHTAPPSNQALEDLPESSPGPATGASQTAAPPSNQALEDLLILGSPDELPSHYTAPPSNQSLQDMPLPSPRQASGANQPSAPPSGQTPNINQSGITVSQDPSTERSNSTPLSSFQSSRYRGNDNLFLHHIATGAEMPPPSCPRHTPLIASSTAFRPLGTDMALTLTAEVPRASGIFAAEDKENVVPSWPGYGGGARGGPFDTIDAVDDDVNELGWSMQRDDEIEDCREGLL